jgi:hypothetical protein
MTEVQGAQVYHSLAIIAGLLLGLVILQMINLIGRR